MSGRAEDVTVLIATRARPDLLASTLESLAGCEFPRDRFSVVVADNAGDPATREVCGSSATSLRIEHLVVRDGGKNAALNHALERSGGELLLFTDDDVRVDTGWISEMWEGARRWPDREVFGGRVLPLWPSAPPEVVLGTKYTGVAYAILDPDMEEGTDPDFLPFGPNFAVRRQVFERDTRFDPSLGPRPGPYTMGGETELLVRLREDGSLPVFLPDSVVHHRIRASQYSYRWLLGRARKFGRSLGEKRIRGTAHGEVGPPDRVPGWLYRGVAEFGVRSLANAILGRKSAALERAMDAAIELGKLDVYREIVAGDGQGGAKRSGSSPVSSSASGSGS